MAFFEGFRSRALFKPAEAFMLMIASVTGLIDLVLISLKNSPIDWLAYLRLMGVVIPLLAGGLYYRLSGRNEHIASALLCTAIFIFFSMTLSVFNYLLLPVSGNLMDETLASIDALFGYHWPDVMALAAEYPTFSLAMKFAYMSTVPQLALLVVILGLTGKHAELHRMLATITITGTFAICFWGIFPSMGPTILFELPPELWRAAGAVVEENYANDMRTIAEHGPSIITPAEIRGLVAFPSYHAVLAFIAIHAAWKIRYLAPIFVALNLLILPSIFVHGGHHLVDLPAGFFVFLAATFLAGKAISSRQATHTKLANQT